MRIEFFGVKNGWGVISFSHRYIPEIVRFDLGTDNKTVEVDTSRPHKDFYGEFTVSYIDSPVDILSNLKEAAENLTDCTISFDAEGKDSTIYLRHIAGEYFEILWRTDKDNFGGITSVKQSEILAAMSELMDFINRNRAELELNWGDKL